MIINQLFILVQNQDRETLHSRLEEHTLQVEQEIISLNAQGADINPRDPETGANLLYFIAVGLLSNNLLKYFATHHITNIPDNPLLIIAAENNNLQMIEWLIQNGQNINIQDSDGETALHEAVRKGHIEIAQYLLENGADINIRNNEAETALFRARWCTTGITLPIIELLVKHGCDINVQNYRGETALYSYVVSGQLEIVRYLLENGVDANIRNNTQKTVMWSFFATTLTNEVGERVIIPNSTAINILDALLEYGSKVDLDLISYVFSSPVSSPFINPLTRPTIVLLLLANVDVSVDSDKCIYIGTDKLNEIFSVEGYEKQKIAAGYNLYKVLTKYGESNQNQSVLNNAASVNQLVLNNSVHLLQLAVDIAKPQHLLRHDIEQSNNIGFLRDNELKCIKLKELDTKLKELGIQLEEIFDQRSPFYEFSHSLDYIEETEVAITKRITEIFIKDLKLPELPDKQSLIEELQNATNPQEKTLAIQKLQAHSMKEVFHEGDLMGLVCSFLDPQSASNFSYTNKNPLETVIQFSDQETLGAINNQTRDATSEG